MVVISTSGDFFTVVETWFNSLLADPETASVAPSSLVVPKSDWQTDYRSPNHIKLRKEGRNLDACNYLNTDRILSRQYRSQYPHRRVYCIKAEAMNSDTPTMGQGTPAKANRKSLFNQEMEATKHFLSDYSRRRGFRTRMPTVHVVESEVRDFKKRRVIPQFDPHTETMWPQNKHVLARKRWSQRHHL